MTINVGSGLQHEAPMAPSKKQARAITASDGYTGVWSGLFKSSDLNALTLAEHSTVLWCAFSCLTLCSHICFHVSVFVFGLVAVQPCRRPADVAGGGHRNFWLAVSQHTASRQC
jgi:hypothetical protein